VLARIDKGLALLSWLAAAAVAVMLLAGPKVIAHDSKQAAAVNPYASSTAAPDPKALFVSNCGSCHTLAKAGTSGQVGPKLTNIGLDQKSVEAMMKAGPGVMPSFDKSLSPADFHAIAKFVSES
jgi:mono/diheme cytochrome c family protein